MHRPTMLLACAVACSPVLAAPLPVTAFTEPDQYSQPSLSPDGKYLAINVRTMRRDRTVPTLTIYALPDMKIVSRIGLKGYELLIDYTWVSNRRLVASKALEVGLRERPEWTGELVAFDVDGTKFEYLYGYKMFTDSSRGDRYGADYGAASISGLPVPLNNHVYVSTHLWDATSSTAYDIDAVSAIRKLTGAVPARHAHFVLQDDGMARFASAVADNDEMELYRSDSKDQWTKLPDELGRALYPIDLLADNSTLLATYAPDGGPATLVHYALKDGTIRTIASDPTGSIDSLEWMTGEVHPEPFAAHHATGIPSVYYFQPDHADARLHRQLAAQFPGEQVRFVTHSRDGAMLVFWVGSDRDPGSYFLYNRATGKADLLFSNQPLIDPDAMGERRPIRYAARDGVEIEGYLTLPPNPAHRRLPLIVMPHGGPIGVRSSWYFDPEVQFLASRGYAVLEPNFRGSGGRGRAFETAGFRQWGGKMMDDIIDGVKWAARQPDIDGARVCTFGASFGGYAALMLPVREPTMFKCAVGYAGEYDLTRIYGEEHVAGNKSVEAFYRKTVGQDDAELRRFSPAFQAGRITLPVLLVHGGKDKTCPPVQFDVMKKALTDAGHAPETIFEPDEGHGFFDAERRANLYTKLEQFFAAHLSN